MSVCNMNGKVINPRKERRECSLHLTSTRVRRGRVERNETSSTRRRMRIGKRNDDVMGRMRMELRLTVRRVAGKGRMKEGGTGWGNGVGMKLKLLQNYVFSSKTLQ